MLAACHSLIKLPDKGKEKQDLLGDPIESAALDGLSWTYNGQTQVATPGNMGKKEKAIEKKYYTIGEVAAIFNVATSLIRFWESEFDIISPKKNRKGNRQFTPSDIENVRLIYHLVKEQGYTLQGARDILKNGTTGAKDKMEVIASLKDIRSFLAEIKNQF